MTAMPMTSDLLDAGMQYALLSPSEPLTATSSWSVPCHDGDPELWFADTPHGVEAAKELCRSCPLREACLAGARERSEPWGVWGGELFEQGVVVPRKRPRGRPRKTEVA